MAMVQIRLALSLTVSTIAHILLFSQVSVRVSDVSTEKATVLSARVLSTIRSDTFGEDRTAVSLGSESRTIPRGGVPATELCHPAAGRLKAEERSPLSLVSPEDYLPASVLTSLPSPVDSVDPTPPGFSMDGILGEIELLLLISSDGDVDAIVTVSSTLPQFFVDYAKSAFSRTRFTPGLVNNTAVRSRIRIILAPTPSHVDPETGNPLSAKNRRR